MNSDVRRLRPAASTAGCLVVALLLGVARPVSANPVLEWNALMLEAVRQANTGPTLSTRNLAILHAAIFDAVNSIDRVYQPYRYQFATPVPTDAQAAAIQAGRDVASALYPGFAFRARELFDEQRRRLDDNDATRNGLTLGTTAALWMLEARLDDGASTQVTYVPSAEPGQWRRTAPYFRPPLDPHWRYVELFCLDDLERFVVPPPPSLDSEAYARDWLEVKEWGTLDSSLRTDHDSETAVFWSDFSYTAMPPGHWHEIAQGIARQRELPLIETARLFALLSFAQADAAVICWEGKYRYNLWRPETAIQRADEDANAATTAADWQPWLVAPNFPEYPSGHSTFSHAAAAVIAEFFGVDAMEFDARSDSLPGVVRRYSSLKECAREVGRSRILGGIHFQFASKAGERSGEAIGRFIARNWLLPNSSLPALAIERSSTGSLQVRAHGPASLPYSLQSTGSFDGWIVAGAGVGRPGGEVWTLLDFPDDAATFFRLTMNDAD